MLLCSFEDNCFASRSLNLDNRTGTELVGRDSQGFGDFAAAKDLDKDITPLNEPPLAECTFIDRCTRIEYVERAHVHDSHVHGKRIAETALRQTALNWSLAALEVLLSNVAGAPGLLALLASARSLAETGANAATKALRSLFGTRRWRQA